jgi:putative signal transducing protein
VNLVVVTVVQTVGEADVIAGMLRSEGIACMYPDTPWWSEGAYTGGYEVRVAEQDYERARELIEADESRSPDSI